MDLRLPSSVHVLERNWLSSNNVLLIGADDTALIDSGYVTHAPQTLALVRHLLGDRPLDRLLNTHLHSDHCGGNAALQAAYGCHTATPALEAAKVARWDEAALSFRATGQQCPRFGVDGVLAPGDSLLLGGLRWQVLAAPGHDPHALLIFCAEEGVLVSGDALWQDGFGVIFPELAGEPGFDEVGATLVSRFSNLPVVERFFAGGDNSVRGFAYNALSPTQDVCQRDATTHLPILRADGSCATKLGAAKVGGKDVITGTVEVIRDLPRNFGVAAFFDYGNAFNRFGGTPLEYSVGVGFRVRLPVVTLGVDIAEPISRSGASPRLHINFSPKL